MIDIVTGATAGVLANHASSKLSTQPHLAEHGECLHRDIHTIRDHLETQRRHHDRACCRDVDQLLQVASTTWLVLSTHGRQHTYIFMPVPSVQLTFDITGLGQMNFTLAAGWTEVSLPEGTKVQAASGSVNLLYRCSDTALQCNTM